MMTQALASPITPRPAPLPDLRETWSLYRARRATPEDFAQRADIYCPEPETLNIRDEADAHQRLLQQAESEGWEVGFLLYEHVEDARKPGARGWDLCVLEPATPAQLQEVQAGELPGYVWVRDCPPRLDQHHALHDLRRFLQKGGGRTAYCIEYSILTRQEHARIRQQLLEQGIR